MPVHLDGVYFEGASKFQFPQWLLAAMKFSGLWEEQFIPQVQVQLTTASRLVQLGGCTGWP